MSLILSTVLQTLKDTHKECSVQADFEVINGSTFARGGIFNLTDAASALREGLAPL